MNIPDQAQTAWHYSEGPGGTLYDGSPVPDVGEVHSVEGEVRVRANGMHACEDPWDSLRYAPGAYLERVAVWGDVEYDYDKVAGRHRVVLERWDVEDDLRSLARWIALDGVRRFYTLETALNRGVADEYIRMVEWLDTGEGDRAAGQAASWAAAWAAADAAEDAGSTAASAAARAADDAARDAALAAARDAASAAGWAADDAAGSAAAKDRYQGWYYEMIHDATGHDPRDDMEVDA